MQETQEGGGREAERQGELQEGSRMQQEYRRRQKAEGGREYRREGTCCRAERQVRGGREAPFQPRHGSMLGQRQGC
jgi:hypothetical protein